LLAALVAFVAALTFAGGASAYGWPVRPFNKPHPIRGGFGDPRTVFSLGFFSNPWEGPGSFSFHNGIDISARPDTPVYPVTSGIARVMGAGQVDVESPLTNATRRVFQYEHITPHVQGGQRVVARKSRSSASSRRRPATSISRRSTDFESRTRCSRAISPPTGTGRARASPRSC